MPFLSLLLTLLLRLADGFLTIQLLLVLFLSLEQLAVAMLLVLLADVHIPHDLKALNELCLLQIVCAGLTYKALGRIDDLFAILIAERLQRVVQIDNGLEIIELVLGDFVEGVPDAGMALEQVVFLCQVIHFGSHDGRKNRGEVLVGFEALLQIADQDNALGLRLGVTKTSFPGCLFKSFQDLDLFAELLGRHSLRIGVAEAVSIGLEAGALGGVEDRGRLGSRNYWLRVLGDTRGREDIALFHYFRSGSCLRHAVSFGGGGIRSSLGCLSCLILIVMIEHILCFHSNGGLGLGDKVSNAGQRFGRNGRLLASGCVRLVEKPEQSQRFGRNGRLLIGNVDIDGAILVGGLTCAAIPIRVDNCGVLLKALANLCSFFLCGDRCGVLGTAHSFFFEDFHRGLLAGVFRDVDEFLGKILPVLML